MNNKLRMIKSVRDIIIVYLSLTVFFYFFGPIKWKIDNGIWLFLYLFINYAAFYFGYNYCYNKKLKKIERLYGDDAEWGAIDLPYSSRVFKFLALFSIISHSVYAFYVFGGININKALYMAQSYIDTIAYEKQYNLYTQILTYLWGINYFYLPIGIFSTKKMNMGDKILFILAIVTEVLYSLSMGTMKGLGDVVIIAGFCLLLLTKQKGRTRKEVKRSKKRKRLIILIAILFLIVFWWSMYGREELRGTSSLKISAGQPQAFVIEEKEWPLPHLTTMLIFYFSHGYTGLAYALKLPFKWTYGVGNSRALTSMIETHLDGTPISDNTYVERLERVYGWRNGGIWPSAFSWIASDITFWLIPVLLFALGYLLCKCMYETVFENSTQALVLGCYLCVFFVYLPCNNQIVQAHTSLFALVMIGLLYFLKTKRIHFVFGRNRPSKN